ncbi:hypothetical protein AJ80_05606 [Polytolypa hystricis UAMH7299]|uniref:Uncharacterized protein n=1 Tax=Polytolypa hystricis (strain UAMH7299) TaxID=1447883 RepID=A0A2B7Y2I5_POLH7|nr:hypothetical protein AJ80_05606 [Polytolypa hystricis UAMH7299]
MTQSPPLRSVVAAARQSPPIDFNSPVPLDFIKGKTILITGGASGIGAAFFTKWAEHGAAVIIGDINVEAGTQLVASTRKTAKNDNLHFLPLDVTSWPSQVEFFREAAKLSPHGGIDTVVANAGVNLIKESSYFETPPVDYQHDANPPPPPLKTVDINLTGVMYTSHLATFYLARNPGSADCSPTSDPATTPRDRHLILIGSIASVYPIMSQVPYCVSKHGVLGLYRCLRATGPLTSGVRVNMLCPYFIDTPLIDPSGRAVLAGASYGKVDDVVHAATRFVADPRCVGRAVVVGPRLRVREPEEIAVRSGADGVPGPADIYDLADPEGELGSKVTNADGVVLRDVALWEIHAHDLENTDIMCHRMMTLFNTGAQLRGWKGVLSDLWLAFLMALARCFGGKSRRERK